MKCPNCGSTELKVEVSFAGQVACKFVEGGHVKLIEDVALDSNWDDHSCCECIDCLWVGTVQNAREGRAGDRIDRTTRKSQEYLNPITTDELEDLKHLIDVQSCLPFWRERIERLISEVERLNAFIEMISRLTNATPESGIASNEDTVVG